MKNMEIGVVEVVMWLLSILAIICSIDKIISILTEKSPLKLAKTFDNALSAFLPLAVAMLGILCFAPIIADLLRPIVLPILSFFGADPGLVGGLITAIDMGAFPIALELAANRTYALFSGIVVGAMFGVNWVFNIPVGLSIIPKADYSTFAKGLLAGLITVPVGALVGGTMLGMGGAELLANMAVIIIAAIIVCIALAVIPEIAAKVCIWLGRIMMSISVLGIGLGVFQWLTGYVILPRLAPITPDAVVVIGNIALVMIGAYTLVDFLQRAVCAAGVKATGVIGFIATLANNIPMFNIFKDMNENEKILNSAFQTATAFVICDHLAFTLVFAPEAIPVLFASKLSAGLTSLPVAQAFYTFWKRRKA